MKKNKINLAPLPPPKKQDLYNYRKGSNQRKISFYLKQPSPEKKMMKAAAGRGGGRGNRKQKSRGGEESVCSNRYFPHTSVYFGEYRIYYYSPTAQLPELCLQQAQHLWCLCCEDSLFLHTLKATSRKQNLLSIICDFLKSTDHETVECYILVHLWTY